MSIAPESIDKIFTNAHTVNGFHAKPVEDALLQKALELAQLAPTAFNCCPMRVVFVKSDEGKEKLKKCLMEGNVAKTMEAPVTAIVCFDTEFVAKLPELCPAFDAKAVFDSAPPMVEPTMLRNGNLQGGYLILALRAMGLDCGPMSGFDNAAVDAVFLEGTTWKSNFLINIGYGVAEKTWPRAPRLPFETATKFA
jgi:3-hydroxypropanoate dehydrogenase